MFWQEWSVFDFLCYTGILILASSSVTVWYVMKNYKEIKSKEKIIEEAKPVEIIKRKEKSKWQIRFHRRGTIPEDAEKRIFPPLHPGGPVEKEIDKFIRSKLDEGKTREEAWTEAAPKYYPENALADKVYMRGEFDNMKKRISRRSKSRKP